MLTPKAVLSIISQLSFPLLALLTLLAMPRTAFHVFSNLLAGRSGGALRGPWKVKRSWTGTEKSLSHHYPAPLVFAAGQHVDHGSLGLIPQMVKKNTSLAFIFKICIDIYMARNAYIHYEPVTYHNVI